MLCEGLLTSHWLRPQVSKSVRLRRADQGDRAGRNEWLGQETGHNHFIGRSLAARPNDTKTSARMRFAANAAAARSPTLQRGVNEHPVTTAVNTAAAQ